MATSHLDYFELYRALSLVNYIGICIGKCLFGPSDVISNIAKKLKKALVSSKINIF